MKTISSNFTGRLITLEFSAAFSNGIQSKASLRAHNPQLDSDF